MVFNRVGTEFKRIVQPNPEVTRVMEYACGTGWWLFA